MAEPIDLPFGLWLGWAEGSTGSVVFSRWRQCALRQSALMWVHIGATWRMRVNRSSAAAMRPYVKLLWPLVLHSWCKENTGSQDARLFKHWKNWRGQVGATHYLTVLHPLYCRPCSDGNGRGTAETRALDNLVGSDNCIVNSVSFKRLLSSGEHRGDISCKLSKTVYGV